MTIMKCPRCGGGGYIYESWRQGTTAGQQQSLCPSCSGRGYVTDEQIQTPPNNSPNLGMPRVTWVNPIVTREPERIERMLASIRSIWQRFPDWRLGQLLANAVPDLERNIFYTEDTVSEEKLEAFEGKMDEALDRCLKNMGQ